MRLPDAIIRLLEFLRLRERDFATEFTRIVGTIDDIRSRLATASDAERARAASLDDEISRMIADHKTAQQNANHAAVVADRFAGLLAAPSKVL